MANIELGNKWKGKFGEEVENEKISQFFEFKMS